MGWKTKVLFALLVGSSLVYVYSGFRKKSFDYFVDTIGNQNGRMEQAEFHYIQVLTEEFGGPDFKVREGVCLPYFIKYDEHRVFPLLYRSIDDIIADTNGDHTPVHVYLSNGWLAHMGMRKEEKNPKKFGIVKFSYQPRFNEIDASSHFINMTYYTCENGDVRQESASSKIMRYLKTVIN